ncbi:hypothetical protein EM6_2474 [Asticcacaulis excentricus]|uniref:Uncharacterized protein n=1 Tax=Asticcacaulis excentricus TaxID=78587 RepID=A0A3G9G5D8_9CAUL|nr:hypothetical protein EM6_2474 [Asticcacaulis excentricus]
MPDLTKVQTSWENLWSGFSFSLGNTVHPLSVLSSENIPDKSVAQRLLTKYGEGYGFLTRILASLQ